MGKATSDRAPESRFTVERNLIRPKVCDVTFYVHDGKDDHEDAEGKAVYAFDVYRLIDWPWRGTLAEDIETNYDTWLQLAIGEEARSKLHDPTTPERLNQIEAGMIELAAIIAGGE